ncbi:MAG: PilZ domain-containing protein [Proteobacteria bacterium]|nr:PilZ domain-containing protein [Pseudomonadota bacterium]MDA1291767.1 PilZ domain-containing protein [Pseudomonadota bacterium]
MSKHQNNATEVAQQILQTLRAADLLSLSDENDTAVLESLSAILVYAGFPERDVLEKNITILLSDIRGFSDIAESYPAADVVRMLNRYFDAMGNIITKYDGTIDKLMGDSILVVFGFPEERETDAENAIACAVEMQMAMSKLNDVNRSLDMPDLFTGIAVNTGSVVVGDLGSKHYHEYTIIGDEVNLTSRIEAQCLRGQILISENTFALCKEFIEVGPPNRVEVKGAREAVDLYELHATARPQPMEVPRREGRKSPRIKVNMPVAFQNLAGEIVLGEYFYGEVIDISYHGLLIETPIKLGKSSEIKMALSIELFSDRTTDVYARIINTEISDKKFRSSMEFTTIGTEGLLAIKQYVDKMVATS